MISDEEAQQLMCPPADSDIHQQSASEVTGDTDGSKTLERMNSFHVGPVKLPHPVKMPNGRVSNSRASSEDYTKNTATHHPQQVRDFQCTVHGKIDVLTRKLDETYHATNR